MRLEGRYGGTSTPLTMLTLKLPLGGGTWSGQMTVSSAQRGSVAIRVCRVGVAGARNAATMMFLARTSGTPAGTFHAARAFPMPLLPYILCTVMRRRPHGNRMAPQRCWTLLSMPHPTNAHYSSGTFCKSTNQGKAVLRRVPGFRCTNNIRDCRHHLARKGTPKQDGITLAQMQAQACGDLTECMCSAVAWASRRAQVTLASWPE